MMTPGDRIAGKNQPLEVPPRAPARPPMVKIDNALRKHTQAVEVEKLNQLGVTTINFISLSKINQLISLAVHKAFEKYQRLWNENEAAKIQEEVRAELEKQLSRRQPPAGDLTGQPAGLETLAEQQRSLENDVEELRPAIETRVRELESEKRGDSGRWSILCSEEGLADLEKLVRGLVTSEVAAIAAAGQATSGQLNGQQHDLEPDRLVRFEKNLHEVLRKVMTAERCRIQEDAAESSAQKTEILEKRLEKLKIHLAEMEQMLKKMAAAKGIDAGLPSFFRDLQGLQLDDGQFGKKKGMLKAIFEDNIKLQEIACTESLHQME